MDCIENIVTIGVCDDTAPTSGLKLIDAPEISQINLARIATEKDGSGTELADRVLNNAVIQVRNDLLTVLAQNQMLVDVSNRHYETTEFKPTVTKPAEATERGVTINKVARPYGKSLKKLTLHKIRIFPLADVTGATFYIHDDGDLQPITTTFTEDLVGGQINEFTVNYRVLGRYAHVTTTANVAMASAYLHLCAGCAGRLPNDCAYTESYYNGRSLKGREGYGVGVEFSCECDYDSLMCNLAKTTLGKIIWQKARIMLMQERLNSNRLNNWIVYGETEIKEYHLPKLESEYQTDWEAFVKSLKTIVAQYSGDCIICNGIRSVISI